MYSEIRYNRFGYPIVYTDGACRDNGYSNACAGIGVFWADNHPDNVSCRLRGPQTNNRAEIEAAIVAIRKALKNDFNNLDIHTDSQFMINAMTNWIHKWKRNGWRTSNGSTVRNRDDWIRLDHLQSQMNNVMWTKVNAHSGNYGNKKADWLANRPINL